MHQSLLLEGKPIEYSDIMSFAGEKLPQLPFTLRILLENTLRHQSLDESFTGAPEAILDWQPNAAQRPSIPFLPARVLLQDFTGVPLLVDLAAMRSAKARVGGNPDDIAPKIPVDLVVDHSIQVDFNQFPDSLQRNMALEFQRNKERYQLIRWAQEVLPHFRVVPPGKGIVHQVNLEYLADVVSLRKLNGKDFAFPDTVFGTDSHTTMINGLGVLGWGVGGIEAIAALLGKPTHLVLPDVIGLTFEGKLPKGATPTDLTLLIVEQLRLEGVVGKFIECFGHNLGNIPVPDRAMIANMAPETGATVIYFPVDDLIIDYLKMTGRSPQQASLVETYCKNQGLFRTQKTPKPEYSKVIVIDLSMAQTCLAGPFRPQDRVEIPAIRENFVNALGKAKSDRGFGLPANRFDESVTFLLNGKKETIRHGTLLIAAITSCTNTSNPTVMLAAGLLAKKAVERGMKISPLVKCSLMPGSQVVSAYLDQAGLLDPLSQLGFNLTGYGCGTCIGNSGPLAPEIVQALEDKPIITASISSGNRNFEGRIHSLTKANYLASPPQVIAYALAGRIDIDLTEEPLGVDADSNSVYLADIYPSNKEIEDLYQVVQTGLYQGVYSQIFTANNAWDVISPGKQEPLFPWGPYSTYIKEPPYLFHLTSQKSRSSLDNIEGARVLAILGDSITTDHISPAGSIPLNSPAGEYLRSLGVAEEDFNSYGARRGNDQVMVRGTFANIRLKNKMTPGIEGGYTRHYSDENVINIFDAAQKYQQENIPLIIFAGKEYGTGSSRDWAAKGPCLLNVKAVIAESFERIHRSNLAGMGIIPLEFMPGENADYFNITGNECFDILGLDHLRPGDTCQVKIHRANGTTEPFETLIRIETNAELKTFLAGGILIEAVG
jgi:aconitate hydratase